MTTDLLPAYIRENYEIHQWKHACAILAADFPNELRDIVQVLSAFRLPKSHILAAGGQKSLVSAALDSELYRSGWVQKKWHTSVLVDDSRTDTPTHNVDCFKNGVAIEIEWSNKDPFFDRDLNNFRLLFDLRVISVGVIITKSDELKNVFRKLGVYRKYGASTTWMSKLLPRVNGAGAGGCPLLVFGITRSLYIDD